MPPPEERKKFIRTFAGDAATLQQGGKPELVPFESAQPVVVEAQPQPAAVPPASPASLEPIPVSPIPIPQAPIAPAPIAPAPVAPPSPPAVAMPQPAVATPVSNVPETYAGDFSARVKETNASTATVIAAQQDAARGAPRQPVVAQKGGSIFFVLGGLVLLLVAGGGAYYAYSQYGVVQVPIAITPVTSAPIFVDERAEISGTGDQLAQAIAQSVQHPLAAGTVRFLYANQATSTGNSVFAALQLPAPDVLLRNIDANGSMAGVVNIGGVQSPFFILSVQTYGETFAGMLSWESRMPRDLALFFPAYPALAPVVATTTTATSTATSTTTATKPPKTVAKPAPPPVTASTTPPVVLSFHDEVIANHDTRVYRDASGRSVILYGYWDQSTLVIARDEAAFTEILRRLATSRSQESL